MLGDANLNKTEIEFTGKTSNGSSIFHVSEVGSEDKAGLLLEGELTVGVVHCGA